MCWWSPTSFTHHFLEDAITLIRCSTRWTAATSSSCTLLQSLRAGGHAPGLRHIARQISPMQSDRLQRASTRTKLARAAVIAACRDQAHVKWSSTVAAGGALGLQNSTGWTSTTGSRRPISSSFRKARFRADDCKRQLQRRGLLLRGRRATACPRPCGSAWARETPTRPSSPRWRTSSASAPTDPGKQTSHCPRPAPMIEYAAASGVYAPLAKSHTSGLAVGVVRTGGLSPEAERCAS